MPSNKVTLLMLLMLIAVAAGSHKSTVAAAQSSGAGEINFLSIIVDKETAAADTRLKRFLEKAVSAGSAADASHRRVRFPLQTMPYGDVIRAFAEAGSERGVPRPHHAVCVCRRRDAWREAEHPRRLPERRDPRNDLPLVLRRAQRQFSRAGELEAGERRTPASKTSRSI